MIRLDRNDFIEQLQRAPYFSGLDATTLHALAGLATWHEYAPHRPPICERAFRETPTKAVFAFWQQL